LTKKKKCWVRQPRPGTKTIFAPSNIFLGSDAAQKNNLKRKYQLGSSAQNRGTGTEKTVEIHASTGPKKKTKSISGRSDVRGIKIQKRVRGVPKKTHQGWVAPGLASPTGGQKAKKSSRQDT